jgi:hypothetical protein
VDNVFKEHSVFIFWAKDGGSMFIWNVETYLSPLGVIIQTTNIDIYTVRTSDLIHKYFFNNRFLYSMKGVCWSDICTGRSVGVGVGGGGRGLAFTTLCLTGWWMNLTMAAEFQSVLELVMSNPSPVLMFYWTYEIVWEIYRSRSITLSPYVEIFFNFPSCFIDNPSANPLKLK